MTRVSAARARLPFGYRKSSPRTTAVSQSWVRDASSGEGPGGRREVRIARWVLSLLSARSMTSVLGTFLMRETCRPTDSARLRPVRAGLAVSSAGEGGESDCPFGLGIL